MSLILCLPMVFVLYIILSFPDDIDVDNNLVVPNGPDMVPVNVMFHNVRFMRIVDGRVVNVEY